MLPSFCSRTIQLIIVLASASAAYGQATFTLDAVMSSPFPSELVASEHRSRIAWVFNAKGVRNVWTADGPDFVHTARQVTHYGTDNGQSIASLRLTPDGRTAVYALGSELNDAQESANPASSTKGAQQQVFAIEIDSRDAQPRVLGAMGCPEEDCEDIEISPDGAWALWSAKKKLWLASIDGKQPAKELATVRGSAVQPKWSPDGKHIAFVSQRDDHSFVAIYDFGGDSVRYMAPSVDKDSMPRWSPDGKSIVFVRTPGDEQKRALIPIRPTVWSLWIADAGTGTGHALWRSGEKADDSFPDTEDVSLKYADNGRVVFSSEQDGRNHLYSINANGGPPALLTPGNFDVEDVALTANKQWIIYSSNQDDVDRRPESLSKDFPSDQLVIPKQVVFKSADGLTLHGQLFLPRNSNGKVPGVVFMHGGPIRQMMLGFHYMDYYHNAYAENQYLCSRGYAVLSVNYRLGIMYGRAFREAPHTIWRGASEYKDVVAAGRYLQALAIKMAWESSPDAYVSTWKSPVLLVHGDDDRNVPFSQTVALAQRLREQHVPFEQLIIPDEIHGFLIWRDWIRAYTATEEFFDRTLKRGEKIGPE